jgi:hypothetical protein
VNILPHGRRQTLCLALRLGTILAILAAAATFLTAMPGRSYSGPFEPLSEDEALIRDDLRDHVSHLADSIGERNMEKYQALRSAADYIERCFQGMGYAVQEQPLQVSTRSARNIEVSTAGSRSLEEALIVGAHYDSASGSPGANDNATGVAALLELARHLKFEQPGLTVRLVVFANEEPPYFQTDDMGSRKYATRVSDRGERIVGMVSLETLGCYSDLPGSQRYPFGFGAFYPSRGDFVGFVGNIGSRKMVRRSIQTFRQMAHFPSEGVTAPGWFTGIGWSDHWSFWRQGLSAIMITDTALFRYKYYHTAADTPNKIDYDRTARVVAGIFRVILDLAR